MPKYILLFFAMSSWAYAGYFTPILITANKNIVTKVMQKKLKQPLDPFPSSLYRVYYYGYKKHLEKQCLLYSWPRHPKFYINSYKEKINKTIKKISEEAPHNGC